MSTPTQTYCNNCDNIGHNFSACRKPLTSSGIITYRHNDDNKLEYLMVCRKHTYGYIDFMRGKYSINNKDHIKDIIYEMTITERNNIHTLSFIEIWLDLWGSDRNAYFMNEKTFANEKFKSISKGVYINQDFYNIHSLLDECKSSWITPEWSFPKGRKNYKESIKHCALREWSEETGFHKTDVQMIENISSYDEVVIGSNYQSYKDIYYIGKFIGKTITPIIYQRIEISDAKWMTYEEVCKHIRPYHLERLKIIKVVNTLLNKYTHYIYG
jgi:ADP-ribose pyrophosphatase YjhB (NUDIX family)